MPNNISRVVQGLVDAFQDFADFCAHKWRAMIMAIIFLVILGAIGLSFYYIYRQINRVTDFVETVHVTPGDMQRNLEESVATSILIERELTSLLLTSRNAASAAYFKFHNSTTDLQGRHNFYYSGAGEVARFSEQQFITPLQSVPVARLGQFMVPFLDGQCQFVYVEKINGNAWFKTKLSADNIGLLAMCPVHDKQTGYLIGFAELIYTQDAMPSREESAIVSCLKNTANAISILITTYKN